MPKMLHLVKKAQESKSYDMMTQFLNKDELILLENKLTNSKEFKILRQRAMTRKLYNNPKKYEDFKNTKKKYQNKLLIERELFLKINPEELKIPTKPGSPSYLKHFYGTADKSTVEQIKKDRQDKIKETRIQKNILKIENHSYMVALNPEINFKRYGITDRDEILRMIRLKKKREYLAKENYTLTTEEF